MTDSKIPSHLKVFRKETRVWLEANCPESMRRPVSSPNDYYWGGRKGEFPTKDHQIWFDRMLEKKWIVPYWDEKYGGGGLSPAQNNILIEEMSRLGCRKPIYSFGISMLGPALLQFATEEQKMKYLPQIVRGEIRWCQGYSEPGAGSDLAGLQTRAEHQGDHYLVNGQKVWTSYGDQSDWIFCLVRTDVDAPKHLGISFLLIDMASEGVSTRPIQLISGKSPFTETFLDHVKVPRENLVGEAGKGWTIAKYLLTHERQMIGGVGETHRPPVLSDVARRKMGLSKGILRDPVLRARIARFEMNEAIFNYAIERVVDEAVAGNKAGALSSFFKYYGTELNKERYELLLALHGFEGLPWEGEAYNEGHLARLFCRTKGNSIEGGTSEIQLNIIAKRILGLPS